MIVEVESKLIKLQVKYATETNGKVTLKLQKSGPNGYRYTYTTLDIDIFSVYIPSIDKVIFVPAKLALKNTKAFNIRFIESKNKQNKFVHFINEFENLDEILKNFNGV